jgi:hypothetical protein
MTGLMSTEQEDSVAETQTYATHRRYVPYFHFFAVPILGINVLVQIYVLIRHFSGWSVWNVLVASALLALALATRRMATTAQDRIIRLEETLRLQRCLPADLQGRLGELTTGQLVGLRFCVDEELLELTRAVLGGELRGREDIKKRIKSWRPDTLRV